MIAELTYEKVEHTPVRIAYRTVGTPERPPVDDTWLQLGEYAREHDLYLIERTTEWRQITTFLNPITGDAQFQLEGGFRYPDERDTQKRLFTYERICHAVDLPPEQWPDLKWWASIRWGTFYTAKPLEMSIARWVS